VGATAWALGRLAIPPDPNMVSGYERILTALVLGGLAAAAYGILWSAANKWFNWSYGEGAGPELPQGWHAAVLSLCTTLPLTILPPAFEFIAKKHIVLPLHYRGSAFMILTAAIAHVLLYGTRTPRIKGLRARVDPPGSPLDFWRAVQMEAIYATVHFVSTVFVYQIVVGSETITTVSLWIAIEKTIISGLVFFTGACSYIVCRYPSSLVPVLITRSDGSTEMNDRWVAVRGVVNGAILMVAFTIGILL